MNTDPVADMLTRIRNAVQRKHEKVSLPNSKIKAEILRVLKEEGYIKDYKIIKVDDKKSANLTIYLKYASDGSNLINKIIRVSKPGCRVYRKVDEFKKVLDTLGSAIVSTHKGVMSDKECRKLKLGGEVICYVY